MSPAHQISSSDASIGTFVDEVALRLSDEITEGDVV
jgi:hypothetical protein